MRCKRCHAKIDGKKKTCPNCGVLVRKKRGLYKLAPTALGGSSGFFDELRSELSRLRPWILYTACGIVLVLIAIICISCVGCSCSGCSGCASCSQEEAVSYADSVNSGVQGLEYYHNGTLYYINSDKIFSLSPSGENKLIAEGAGPGTLRADDASVYYLSNGALYSVPFEKPIVVSEESGSQYAARCLAAPAAEGEDVMTAITGYAQHGDIICYWGTCQSGIVRFMTVDPTSGVSSKLFEAAALSVKYYRGCVYYIDASTGELMLCSVDDGSMKKTGIIPADGKYDLGSGSVCFVKKDGETTYLDRVSLSGSKTLLHMQIDGLAGVMTTDEYIFYWKNDATGGSVMRMTHGGADAKLLLYDAHPVELKGVSGTYFSVSTTSGLDGSLRYWLFDSATQQAVY